MRSHTASTASPRRPRLPQRSSTLHVGRLMKMRASCAAHLLNSSPPARKHSEQCIHLLKAVWIPKYSLLASGLSAVGLQLQGLHVPQREAFSRPQSLRFSRDPRRTLTLRQWASADSQRPRDSSTPVHRRKFDIQSVADVDLITDYTFFIVLCIRVLTFCLQLPHHQFSGTYAFDATACQVGPCAGHSRAPLHCRLECIGSLEAPMVLIS